MGLKKKEKKGDLTGEKREREKKERERERERESETEKERRKEKKKKKWCTCVVMWCGGKAGKKKKEIGGHMDHVWWGKMGEGKEKSKGIGKKTKGRGKKIVLLFVGCKV